MKSKILGLLAVGMLAGPMAANAVPVKWEVWGVLSDSSNTVVTGSFVLDADLGCGATSDVSISAQSLYTVGGGACSQDADGISSVTFYSADFLSMLHLLFFPHLTNAGGTARILASSYEGIDGTTSNFGGGNVTGAPVPEPGTLALFGLGLAGLGLSRRRKAA